MSEELDRFAAELEARVLAVAVPNAANLRKVRREFSERLKGKNPQFVFQLAFRLLGRGSLPRFIEDELIYCHREAMRGLNSKNLERLGRGLNSWGAVDSFACYLAGPAWREKQVPDRLIQQWAKSPDRWWRRAALVSTVPLNNRTRGGKGDAPRTLRICRMLLNDRDDMVVKAMSWALRELAKRDSQSVRDFLLLYGKELAPRALREVRNKLATGLKNPV